MHNMIQRFSIALIFSCCFCSSPAQFDTSFAKTNIRHCADSFTHAFKIKDWELYTRYSYPALIGSLGGKNEFMKFMALSFSPIPDSAWKQYEPGKILQVIKTEGDLQTIIELKSIIEWQGIRIKTVTHLIGESWDGGLFWTFFNSEGDRTAALLIKPDLSQQLSIPQKSETIEPVSSGPKTSH